MLAETMNATYWTITNVRPSSYLFAFPPGAIISYQEGRYLTEAFKADLRIQTEIGHEKAQSVIDSITSSYAAAGESGANPMLGPQGGGPGGPMGGPGFGPPPFGFPGILPPPPTTRRHMRYGLWGYRIADVK